MKVTKALLIDDIKSLSERSSNGVVTRNFYRSNGRFTEAQWQKFFSKFEDFAAEAGVNQPHEVSTIEGNKWSVFLPSTPLCSADDVIGYCKVDTSVWELDRFRAKDVTKGDEPKFQISAFFKKKKNILEIQAEIEDLKNLAKSQAHVPLEIERPSELSGNMLEINISDAHFGKLAWPTETGHEPYDVQIAQAMYIRALNTLLDRTKGYKFDQILFVVGNDLLNSDNAENTTTRGTVVTTDIRYHKTYRIVRTTIVQCIEKLREVAPVKVMIVPGNHDQLASFHLGDSLECYFHNYPDVVVENQPRYRKYHEFGKVLLGFTHGDKGERNDYALLMAAEQPEAFGRTKHREIHTGHTHKTKVDEQHGIRVRVLPALCPPDDWHAENGYVGNLRNAEAYVWNKDEGLVSIVIYNDDSQPQLVTSRELAYA